MEEKKRSPYHKTIKDALDKAGILGKYDPRHIEAFLRVHYGTLDHLSMEDFIREMPICIDAINEGGVETAEAIAQSEGL
jgi:hypothetical protein